MGIVNSDEIRGVCIGGVVLCVDCSVKDKSFDDAQEDNLILEKDIENEDKIYFCDECKKRL